MAIAIISHDDCLLHETGPEHPERPKRVSTIQEALQAYPFNTQVEYYVAPLATIQQIKAAHEKSFVDWIISISPDEGTIYIDEDTAMNPYTLQAAFRAAGAACLAVDLVMENKARAVFCNVRPPGHHAEYDKAMGFCLFNNVAIAAIHAMKQYGLDRIAIIDFDVHHGNGTQTIFQNDSRVLLCSSFQHPYYPGYDQENDNDHIINVPLPAGTTSEQFRAAVRAAWFQRIAEYRPQLIFFSAGFDAHQDDQLADLQLTKADYEWLTAEVVKIANEFCKGRVVSVLEGGYNLAVLQECVPAHVNALVEKKVTASK